MNKNGKIMIFLAVFIVLLLVVGFAIAGKGGGNKSPNLCKDGIDNDGDGLVDSNDPGCTGKKDKSELNSNIACDDGVDNGDADSLADYNDNGCSGPTDTDETDGACDDNLDNDGDGYTDYSVDQGCVSYSDSSEYGTNECDDGIDNDGDGNTDVADSGCSTTSGTTETNCGDSVISGSEVCDGLNIGNETCSTQGFDGGTLSCNGQCNGFITTSCWDDSCSDTDGGISYTTQGTTSGILSGSSYSNADFCIDSVILQEYYCVGKYEYNTNTSCSTNTTSTCSNGACV